MSNDGFVQVPPDSSGRKVDASSLTVGANIVIRQRIVIADPSAPNSIATVTSAGSLQVIHQGPISVVGQVRGVMSLSGIVQVSNVDPIILGPSNQNIGAVSLGPGQANIGFLDSISKTVQVALSTNIGIDAISATVTTRMAGVNDISSGLQVPVGDSLNSAIRVNIVAGSAAGVSQVDDTSFSARAAAFAPIGGMFADSGTGTSLSASHAGAVRITGFRAIHANMRTDGGVKMDDSTNSALRVNVVAGAAAGVSQVDDTSFSTGAAAFVPVGAVFSDAGTGLSLSASHAGALRMTGFRAMHVNLRSADGSEISAGNALNVNVQAISATATVILAAGTNNFGTLNSISRTIAATLASGTNNIGAVSLGAGTANIGFIDGISKTVSVVVSGWLDAGGTSKAIVDSANIALRVVGYGTGGSLPIGNFIDASGTGRNLVDSSNLALRVSLVNATATATVVFATPQTINGISATVTVTTSNPWVSALSSASHGPLTAQLSTSATATVVAAPGAGNFVYVTMVAATNAGTVNTTVQCGPSVSTGEVQAYCVSQGGGFVFYFDPPWKLPGNEALYARCDPNSGGDIKMVINFFIRNT